MMACTRTPVYGEEPARRVMVIAVEAASRTTLATGSIPTIELVGPLGKYTMMNPSTVQQAMRTPQALQWDQIIRTHIAKVELDGAVPVPISWARERMAVGQIIHRSLMRLRVKRDSQTHALQKLQARGCLDGREWSEDDPAASSILPPEGQRIVIGEAASENRIVCVGDIPNSYNKADWLQFENFVFMHMFSGYEAQTEDGEEQVYWMTRPHYGARPSGLCLERSINDEVAKLGGERSMAMDGLYHIPSPGRTTRLGTIVDDFVLTVDRAHPEIAVAITKHFNERYGDMGWRIDAIDFSLNGVQWLIDLRRTS